MKRGRKQGEARKMISIRESTFKEMDKIIAKLNGTGKGYHGPVTIISYVTSALDHYNKEIKKEMGA